MVLAECRLSANTRVKMQHNFLRKLIMSLPRVFRNRSRIGHQTQINRVLAQHLYDTFERDLELADLHGIHFYVQNESVTMYGVVRHQLDRELLLNVVRQITDVHDVIDQLQVVDQPFQSAIKPSDSTK